MLYYSHILNVLMKNFIRKIILDTIKLEKHPIYYLVNLLNKIYDKFGKALD